MLLGPLPLEKVECSEATVMRRLLPFEIFFGPEQVVPMGHKPIFSVQKLPTLAQSGSATLPVSCNGVDIA